MSEASEGGTMTWSSSYASVFLRKHHLWGYTTVDGRNIQTLSIWYNLKPPLPSKLNVNVTWSALAPMDERNQTPNVTFGNTRAETLRFGGVGVQHSACCRVWIFCPSTVSLSDVFTSFGLQTLLCKHHSACCWSLSKNAKHCLFTSKCIRFVFPPIFSIP